MKPLTGLKVLDLSQRLPGPLAGMLLADLGASVTKLEDTHFQDAFLAPELAANDQSFIAWYEELNCHKRLVRMDFQAPSTQEWLKAELLSTDIVLHGLPPKWIERFGLDKEKLTSVDRALVVLELGASASDKSAMHDLNAVAQAGLLQLHVAGQSDSPLAPPFLPVGGISFGQQIALTALALHRQAQQSGRVLVEKVFLYEEILKVLRPFWSERLREQNSTKFLHNGKYPCYALYRTKDGDWVAVAAVEEKFWREFVMLLELELEMGQRFSTEPEIFQQVAKSIKTRSTAELEGLLKHKDICVSLIRVRT